MSVAFMKYREAMRGGDKNERAVQLLRAAADFEVSLEENEALCQIDREMCKEEENEEAQILH